MADLEVGRGPPRARSTETGTGLTSIVRGVFGTYTVLLWVNGCAGVAWIAERRTRAIPLQDRARTWASRLDGGGETRSDARYLLGQVTLDPKPDDVGPDLRRTREP